MPAGKKNNSVIKQRKDSNSFFSKVICKKGYYHLLSFLNNQDQLLDKLWKLICCVLCVACLWGYFSLQTFIFIRLSIFTNKAFVFLQDGRRYVIQLMRKKIPPTNYLATVWEIFDCTQKSCLLEYLGQSAIKFWVGVPFLISEPEYLHPFKVVQLSAISYLNVENFFDTNGIIFID